MTDAPAQPAMSDPPASAEIRSAPGQKLHGSGRIALKRSFRFRDLTLFYIVSALSVRWVATAAAAGPSTLIIWAVALVAFFVPLAVSVVELSSRYPQEGGLYVWTREAFGPFAGFITSWTYWMCNLPFFASVLYFGAGAALFGFGTRGQHLALDSRYYLLFTLFWLTVITVTNILGANAGKWLNNIGSLGSVLPIALLIVLATVSAVHHGSATTFHAHELAPHFDLKNAVFWSTIFFAFAGCEAGSFMGDEIENPRRNIPRALLTSGIVVAAAYIAGTAALLIALPSHAVDGVNGFMHGMLTLSARMHVGWLAAPVALLISLSMVGGAAAFLSSTSRLPFVAGIDSYLPSAFGKIHPRFRTPWIAIGIYGLAGIITAILGQAGTSVRGAYEVLVSMSIFSYFIPYLFLFAAQIRLQKRPVGPDVMRIWGGRPVAIVLASLGFLSTAVTLVLSVIPSADETNKPLAVAKVIGSTAVLIGAGIIVYVIAERKKTRAAAQSATQTPTQS
ncbi:MAG TPA: APC family permease [Acidobacteriaceae bacterium]|nr:APC family permease [Acidobacteriaceae bacterium]